jgi:hypothetical protein
MSSIDSVEYYENNSYRIEQKELRSIYKTERPSDGLLRFMNNMADSVFGVRVLDFDTGTEMHLFYAQYKSDFDAVGVSIPIEDYELADNVTVCFAKEIMMLDSDSDFFEVYNNLQYYRQTALEMLGYLTFDPQTLPGDGFAMSVQKIVPVIMLRRLDSLRKLYGNTIDMQGVDTENKIYLMLDDTNGLIKIGKSKNPKVRERTLQSEKPKTHLIAIWTAPATIEKELHIKYASKRQRGEWFRLSFKELDEIKEFMDSL